MNTNSLYENFKGGPDLGSPSFSQYEKGIGKFDETNGIIGFTREHQGSKFSIIGQELVCTIDESGYITEGKYYTVIGFYVNEPDYVFIRNNDGHIVSYDCECFDYIF